MTEYEIKRIADSSATAAIQQLFLTLGYDIGDPKTVLALQADLRFARDWRGSTELVKRHALKTAITTIVTAALGLLGVLFWRGN